MFILIENEMKDGELIFKTPHRLLLYSHVNIDMQTHLLNGHVR